MSVTGHRPKDLFGYDEHIEGTQWILATLRSLVEAFMARSSETVFVSGMALGVDQWWAEAAQSCGGRLHCYVPFAGQELAWKDPAARARYRHIGRRAEQVHYTRGEDQLRERSFSEVRELLLARNDDMVSVADVVVAVWSGKRSGGTYHCLRSALRAGKRVLWVDPFQRTVQWLDAATFIAIGE